MKKNTQKKLSLHTQTIRRLGQEELKQANGAIGTFIFSVCKVCRISEFRWTCGNSDFC
jgi:hypothetical protein